MSLISNRKRPRGFSESFESKKVLNTGHADDVVSRSVHPNVHHGTNSSLADTALAKACPTTKTTNTNVNGTTITKRSPAMPPSSSSSAATPPPSSHMKSSRNFQYDNDLSESSLSSASLTNSSPPVLAFHNNRIFRQNFLDKKNDIYVIGDTDEEQDDPRDEIGPLDRESEFYLDKSEDDLIILGERNLPVRARNSVDRNNPGRSNSDPTDPSTDLLSLDKEAYAAYNMFNVNRDSVFPGKKQRTNSLPQLPQVRCFYQKLPSNYVLRTPKLGEVQTNVIPHRSDLPPCDDEEGHYIFRENDIFASRFVIIKLLGQGTFGKVVQCFDRVNRQHVAIKIIKNIEKYRDAAKIELRVLSTLKKFDNENINHCIHLRECFDFRGHICIVADLLKISLYDFLSKNRFIAYPGSHIQAVAKQLIRSVTFLHDLNLIHTDLKPENILLHDDSYVKKPLESTTMIASYHELSNNRLDDKPTPKSSRILVNPLIQVIDFGSAIFDDEYHSSVVSTRHYRAPEIVLGVGWSFPCDMWSIGCILVELLIGEPLFRTHDNLEHLAMIEKICGYPIDKEMVQCSKDAENECGLNYFTDAYSPGDDSEYEDDDDVDSEKYDLDSDVEVGDADDDDDIDDVIIDDESSERNSLTLRFPIKSTPEKFVRSVAELERIDVFVSNRIGLEIDMTRSLSHNYQRNKHVINFGNFTFWWFFIDLLKKLFVINPSQRLTAVEAMAHPWFNLGIEDEGTM